MESNFIVKPTFRARPVTLSTPADSSRRGLCAEGYNVAVRSLKRLQNCNLLFIFLDFSKFQIFQNSIFSFFYSKSQDNQGTLKKTGYILVWNSTVSHYCLSVCLWPLKNGMLASPSLTQRLGYVVVRHGGAAGAFCAHRTLLHRSHGRWNCCFWSHRAFL